MTKLETSLTKEQGRARAIMWGVLSIGSILISIIISLFITDFLAWVTCAPIEEFEDNPMSIFAFLFAIIGVWCCIKTMFWILHYEDETMTLTDIEDENRYLKVAVAFILPVCYLVLVWPALYGLYNHAIISGTVRIIVNVVLLIAIAAYMIYVWRTCRLAPEEDEEIEDTTDN